MTPREEGVKKIIKMRGLKKGGGGGVDFRLLRAEGRRWGGRFSKETTREAVGQIKEGGGGWRETGRAGGSRGQTEGNLRDLACTREEQTGTQLGEEARREHE